MIDDQACTRCPTLVANRRRIVHGYGDLTSRIVFIGEAPGCHGADRTGVPFTSDRSGKRLQRILMTLGLSQETTPVAHPRLRCFITNVVRCCPPSNRTPTALELENCAPFLRYELETIDPLVLVPVGRLALHAVGLHYLDYDPGPIRQAHAIPLYAGVRVIVPLIHPSRISNAQVASFIGALQSVLRSS